MVRSLLLLAVLSTAVVGPHASAGGSRDVSIVGGVGVPDLVHLSIGFGVADGVSVEAKGGNFVFNWIVGVGAVVALAGAHNRLILSAEVGVNPTLRPLTLRGGGETIGAVAGAQIGYERASASGFLFRALAGAIVYEDAGVAAGPHLTFAVGWRL